MKDVRSVYGILVKIPGGKRPFARLIHLWLDIIKVDFKKVMSEGVD